MKPQIENVTISVKHEEFIAEMDADLDIDEFYEQLERTRGN